MRRRVALEERAIFRMHAATFAHCLQLCSCAAVGGGDMESGPQVVHYHVRQLIVVNKLQLARGWAAANGLDSSTPA